MHRRNRFRQRYSKAHLATGIYICRLCHDGIHRCFDEHTLARDYSEVSLLLGQPDLQRHFKWVAKQKEQIRGYRR
jgi:hypothetical protein